MFGPAVTQSVEKLGYSLEDRRIVIRPQGGAKTLSLVQGFQQGSGIHSTSYAMCKEGFLTDKSN